MEGMAEILPAKLTVDSESQRFQYFSLTSV